MAKGVGLDAGEYEVKAVEIDGSYRKPRLNKVSFERIAQATGAAGDELHAAREAESLHHVLKGGGIGRDAMQLAFPCREAVLRNLMIPFTGSDKIRKVIKFEAEGEIHSHNVDEMVVDFHTVAEFKDETRVLVAAVPKVALRTTLEALRKIGIEPERVDLDTMALYRLADWAGVFKEESKADADELVTKEGPPPARLVLDVGARSTRVLVVASGHLTDMRALRSGEDSVAEEIAISRGIDLETAREAVLHCLSTGTDFQAEAATIEVPVEPVEPVEPVDGEENGDLDVETEEGAEESSETTLAVRTVNVPCTEVQAAQDRFLVRLRRELMRFMTSVSNLGEIEAVKVTGGGSRMPGVSDVLHDVFGAEPEPLHYLDQMSHGLSEEEVHEYEPRLAVAVGLALGSLGGPTGFNFRQEDLVFTKSFDRIKLPLAIACMLLLFAACFYGLKLYKEVSSLEAVYGKPQQVKQAKASRKRRGGREAKSRVEFTGHLGYLVNRGSPAQQLLGKIKRPKSKENEWSNMMTSLAQQDTFLRIGGYMNRLKSQVDKLQQKTGYIKGMELDSGAAVLQELAEVLESADENDSLGRYLVSEIEMKLPANPRGGGRFLRIVAVFAGEDFRKRGARLDNVFKQHILTARETAFEKVLEGTEALFREGQGAYFTVKVAIKGKVPVRYSKTRKP